MIVTHRGQTPSIHPSATIAPNAVVAGNVTIGPGVRVLWGAVLTAENGAITVGEDVLVMEHAVIRARAGHDVHIGASTLIGPHTHINGATIGKRCFVATGAALFPGARLGDGVEVRIRGVVQVNSWLDDGAIVPIHWIAVGTPATIFPPEKHDEIWAIQRDLDFPRTVYGVDRGTSMEELMRQQSSWYEAHRDDKVVDEDAREG
jgi:carbonic anhydrase/acetyltransferase-like protein (isoleucine patch superfamily)